MSYRELRDFTEMMRALGYPRLISVESFRTPNFLLVADVLYWLVVRYDSSVDLTLQIEYEDDRVEFLKKAAQIMAQRARLKLNIKQLYRADGYAVKELLKIASLLYEALNRSAGEAGSGEAVAAAAAEEEGRQQQSAIPLQTRLEELKEARGMASEIVESGEKLFTLLGKEEEAKVTRDQALQFVESISLNLSSNDPHDLIERRIREQINTVTDNVHDLERRAAELDEEYKSVKSKLERKQTELERAEKRLKSLKKIKPQFMEEYEQHELELKAVYEAYVEKFRNFQYLESELARYHRRELDKKAEHDKSLRKMQQRLREEELRILRGDGTIDDAALDNEIFDSGRRDEGGSSDDEEEDEEEEDSYLRADYRRGNGANVMTLASGHARPRAAGMNGRQGGRPAQSSSYDDDDGVLGGTSEDTEASRDDLDDNRGSGSDDDDQGGEGDDAQDDDYF